MNANQTEQKTRLTWTGVTYGGFNGAAGGICLFSVNWKTQRSKPDWNMRTSLPGYTGKTWESDDREELYRLAEKVLAKWLALVGG